MPQSVIEPTVGEVARAPTRRLLLLSYHFPPDGAVGGLRWEKMSRIFGMNGWAVDVIMRDLTRLPAPDTRRLQRLPDDVRVYSATETDPWLSRMEAGMLRVARSVRPRRANAGTSGDGTVVGLTTGRVRKRRWLVHTHAALVHVERERAWGRAAVEMGMELGRTTRYDVIVSSGPPHMVHDAGRTLALALEIPFVMDLRDPWSAFELEHGDSTSRVWYAIARHFERQAIEAASLVVMNTDLARDEMRRLYPAAAQRIVTVANGADDEPIPAVETDNRFVVRFAGTIYLDRNPGPFFRAAAEVVRRRRLTPAQFGAEFIGDVQEFAGRSVQAMADQAGFGEFLTLGGPRPRDEALRFTAGATMLLNLPQATHQCVPAKLFEYVRFNSWLLVLAEPHSATAQLFRGTTADVVAPNDVDGMADVIERRYLEFVSGKRPQSIGRDGRFDRRRQAGILSDHLSRIIAG